MMLDFAIFPLYFFICSAAVPCCPFRPHFLIVVGSKNLWLFYFLMRIVLWKGILNSKMMMNVELWMVYVRAVHYYVVNYCICIIHTLVVESRDRCRLLVHSCYSCDFSHMLALALRPPPFHHISLGLLLVLCVFSDRPRFVAIWFVRAPHSIIHIYIFHKIAARVKIWWLITHFLCQKVLDIFNPFKFITRRKTDVFNFLVSIYYPTTHRWLQPPLCKRWVELIFFQLFTVRLLKFLKANFLAAVRISTFQTTPSADCCFSL
jgi:hypothetical protein